jgi:leucyl-tRNA synthetase
LKRDAQGKIISATAKSDGQAVEYGGIGTMSKSKKNGVDPQDLVARYGADTVRLFMMFAAPPEMTLEWNDAGVEGAQRFLKRLWKLTAMHVNRGTAPCLDVSELSDSQRAVRNQVHQTIAKAGDDVGRRYTFNTAIAANMELINTLYKFEDDTPQGRAVMQEALDAVTLLLAPIVPHICHALWRALGRGGAVLDQSWPVADESALARDVVELVIQVNGKLRGRINVAAGASKTEIEGAALAEENVRRFVAGKAVKKVVVVPGRLVNIVVQ